MGGAVGLEGGRVAMDSSARVVRLVEVEASVVGRDWAAVVSTAVASTAAKVEGA